MTLIRVRKQASVQCLLLQLFHETMTRPPLFVSQSYPYEGHSNLWAQLRPTNATY